MRLNIGVRENKQFGLLYVSIGNIALFKWNKLEKSLKELSSIPPNPSLPFHYLSSSSSLIPSNSSHSSSHSSLLGFQLKLHILEKNEIVLIMSEDAINNFHPKYRGILPSSILKNAPQDSPPIEKFSPPNDNKSNTNNLIGNNFEGEWRLSKAENNLVKSFNRYFCNSLTKVLKGGEEYNEKEREKAGNECLRIVAKLQNEASKLTILTRSFYATHNQVPPTDYESFPGFLGHLSISSLLASSFK